MQSSIWVEASLKDLGWGVGVFIADRRNKPSGRAKASRTAVTVMCVQKSFHKVMPMTHDIYLKKYFSPVTLKWELFNLLSYRLHPPLMGIFIYFVHWGALMGGWTLAVTPINYQELRSSASLLPPAFPKIPFKINVFIWQILLKHLFCSKSIGEISRNKTSRFFEI